MIIFSNSLCKCYCELNDFGITFNKKFFLVKHLQPYNPNDTNHGNDSNSSHMKNMEQLRMSGLQMLEAYTASPACGTSRFSTITGRYPSRAESSVTKACKSNDCVNDSAIYVSKVTIPTTKLIKSDCSDNNIPRIFQRNGYRTGFVGKVCIQ